MCTCVFASSFVIFWYVVRVSLLHALCWVCPASELRDPKVARLVPVIGADIELNSLFARKVGRGTMRKLPLLSWGLLGANEVKDVENESKVASHRAAMEKAELEAEVPSF